MRRPTVNAFPGLMRPETAARYCDMTPQEFEKVVGAGELPAPLIISGRQYWRLVEIDESTAMPAFQKWLAARPTATDAVARCR